MKHQNEVICRRGGYINTLCEQFIKKYLILVISSLIIVLFICPAAFAQCKTDMECKGDRICISGECVSPQLQMQAPPMGSPQIISNTPVQYSPTYYPPPYPNTYQSNPYQLREPQMVYRRPLSKGWAIPGGILGVIFSGAVLAFGSVSAIGFAMDWSDNLSAVILGPTTALLVAIGTPIVFAAAKSARNGDFRIRGMKGLRITGWVTYGLTLASALSLFVMGFADITVNGGHIAATTVLGVASILCMSIDAFVSGAQAKRAIHQDAMSNQHAENRKQFQWTVAAAPVVTLPAAFPALPWALWAYFKEFARSPASPSPYYIEEGLFVWGDDRFEWPPPKKRSDALSLSAQSALTKCQF